MGRDDRVECVRGSIWGQCSGMNTRETTEYEGVHGDDRVEFVRERAWGRSKQ